jgi:branched-chain amino acid transport system substrate-binding protein
MKIRFAAALAAFLAVSGTVRAEEGVTADTITIGTYGAFTGPASAFATTWYAVEWYYDKINAAGGINGRRIKIVREDDACDPAKGIAAVKRLLSLDGVFMIHGGMCSNVVVATRPDIEKSGIPMMDLAAASDAIATPVAANIFQPIASTATVARGLVDFSLTKAGITKVALVSHSDEWGQTNRKPALEELKQHGLEPVQDLYLERGATDATPQVLRIKTSGAQVVIANLYPTEVAIFLRDAFKYGLSVPVLANQAVSLEQTRERVGNPAATANLYVYYPLAASLASPEMKQWVDLVQQHRPEKPVETTAIVGLGGAVTLVKALREAGPDLTRARLLAVLDKIRDFDTGVMSGPISFTPEDHVGLKVGKMITYRGDVPTVVTSLQ